MASSDQVVVPPECGILTPLDDIRRALEEDERDDTSRHDLSTMVRLVAMLYHMSLYETSERIKRGWRSMTGAPSAFAAASDACREAEEDTFMDDLVHTMAKANYALTTTGVRLSLLSLLSS